MILKSHKITYHTSLLNVMGIRYFILFVIFSALTLLNYTTTQAQEINFGEFSSKYAITISELNPAEDLSFGTVIQNEGIKSIDLINAKVLSIEGVKYLDVLVDITADNHLYLGNDIACNGSNTNCIPFTLQAAYANQGINDTNDAILMQVTSNVATAQFPIKSRGNRPPGPPPTPVYEGYNPALYNETAYLYIYGSLNIGNVNTGSYSGEITITVNYD